MDHPDSLSLRFDGRTHLLSALPPHTAVSPLPPRVRLDGGAERDEYGVVWRDGVPVLHPLSDPAAWPGFVPPPPSPDLIRERMETLQIGSVLRVCLVPLPLLSRAEALAGAEVLRRAMETDPEAAHALLKAVCEGTLAVMEAALQYDFDLIALEEGWDLPAPLRRTFLRPYLARLYAMANAYGRPAAQLGCGAASMPSLLPELEALGLDVLAP